MLKVAPGSEGAFPPKNITEAVIGAAFEVYNQLGYGYLHRVYQTSLQVELTRVGRTTELERRINVHYKGVPVGYYDADLVVDDIVLVEIKNCSAIRQTR